ncbi:Uncharacterised protein [Mycobacteroides abscessus subsp. abscessus]|nr:Uncharacterised protein [Mycobacteroides abscessus subsp. abscessus]
MPRTWISAGSSFSRVRRLMSLAPSRPKTTSGEISTLEVTTGLPPDVPLLGAFTSGVPSLTYAITPGVWGFGLYACTRIRIESVSDTSLSRHNGRSAGNIPGTVVPRHTSPGTQIPRTRSVCRLHTLRGSTKASCPSSGTTMSSADCPRAQTVST